MLGDRGPLESPFNTCRGHSQFQLSQLLWYPVTKPAGDENWRCSQRKYFSRERHIIYLCFTSNGSFFCLLSPLTNNGSFRSLAQDSGWERHSATRLILAFHRGTSEVPNVLLLGISSQCHIPNFHNLNMAELFFMGSESYLTVDVFWWCFDSNAM